jgi:hypothetical protein
MTLIVVTFFSVLIFFFFRGPLDKFHKLERLTLLLFTSFICQHINFKVFSAYDRLSVHEGLIPRIVSFLHYGWIMPMLLMWILALYRLGVSKVLLFLYLLCWIFFDVLTKKLYLLTHMLDSKTDSWYPAVDVGLSLIILLFTSSFFSYFSNIFIREVSH